MKNGVAWDARLKTWIVVFRRPSKKKAHQHAAETVAAAIMLYKRLAAGDECTYCRRKK